MSTFKNVSGVDRDLIIDGQSRHVPDGETTTITDEQDPQLNQQTELWEQVSEKTGKTKDSEAK